MKLFGTQKIGTDGTLHIGEVSVKDIANTYGTPCYILDQTHLENTIDIFKHHFVSTHFQTEILYASKAFSTIGLYELMAHHGLSLDVVSGGELYTAKQAHYPMERVYFHGNFKTETELREAIEAGVGTLIIDNEDEYRRLKALLPKGQTQAVLLRLNPGIEAHTHAYIQTATLASKFGLSLYSEKTVAFIKTLAQDDQVLLKGFHSHIGSQITRTEAFSKAIETLVTFLQKLKKHVHFEAEVLNIGGGFGIYYTDEDTPEPLESLLKSLVEKTEHVLKAQGIQIKKLLIEPGRSLVGNAGSTLYTTSSIKVTDHGKSYVFVDGGMTDNIRPALYGAKYQGAVANKMNAIATQTVTVAGKCCESGDILIDTLAVPDVTAGDLFLINSTGAYGYSMANHYNRHAKPPVILVKEGQHFELVKRETYASLVQTDCTIQHLL